MLAFFKKTLTNFKSIFFSNINVLKKQIYPISNEILNNYRFPKTNVISFTKKLSKKLKKNFNNNSRNIIHFDNNIIVFYVNNYYNVTNSITN